MNTRVLVVTSRPPIREQVRAVLAEAEGFVLVEIVEDGAEIVAALDRFGAVDVVLVDEMLGDRNGLDVAREVGFARPLSAIVLMASHPTPELLAAAMDAGARSIVAAPPSLEEVRSRIESAAVWSRSARRHVASDALPAGEAGQVIAVAGAKGGVGTTLIALLLARSKASDHSVCLVDLDLQAGDLAAFAGVRVRRSIVDLVEVADELNGRALGETTYDIGHGLRLLPAPADGELGEDVTARAVRLIIAALRYQYDLVVIDCGSRLDDATSMALELADRAVLVATLDVPALRAARRTIALWERLEVRASDEVDLVVNRANRVSEVQPALAPKLAGVSVTAVIPQVSSALEDVMNTATVLDSRIGELDRAIDGLAAAVVLTAGPPVVINTTPRPAAQNGRRRHRFAESDAGQVVVESPLIIGIVVVLTLLAIQLILFGVSHIVASNAADEAARGYAVGMDDAGVRSTVQDALPGGWDSGWSVARPTADTVQVSVRTPSIMPGLIPATVSTAPILREPR